MIRSAFSKALLLALTTAVTSATLVNCSNKDTAHEGEQTGGTIGLALEIAPGVNVDAVTYEISGNGIAPIVGTIPVTDPAASVSALVGGIPSGTGYTIKLTATSTDGKTQCLGSSTFNVIAGQTTAVSIDMQCTGEETRGEVRVDGTFNNCPTLTAYSVAPLQVSVGGKINVSAAASDKDTGETLAFSWTSSAGSFAAGNAASTVYTCSQGGDQTLTLSVTDGTCADTATIGVRCVAVLCGNGSIDVNETCDDGNTVGGDACPADCTLPVCGDNIVEGGTSATAETCDDGNTANGDNCPSDCTLPVCGDNKVEAPESCDPPNGTTCSATCQSQAVCGNGVREGSEQCDDGNQVDTDACKNNCTLPAAAVCGNGTVEAPETCEGPLSGTNCGADCKDISTAACLSCEQGSECAEVMDCGIVTGNAASGPASGTARAKLCLEVLDCVRDTHCATGLEINCYCGTASSADCDAGNGNGACRAVLERALETTLPAEVQSRFTNPTFGGGFAMTRVGCDNAFCPQCN